MSHDIYKELRPSNTVKQLGRALAVQLHTDPRRVQLSIHQRLLETPLDQLLTDARAIRDRQFGSRVTYSPKVFIPLTMLCRDKCGYCTFAQPPARLENPYLSADQVLAIAKQGAKSNSMLVQISKEAILYAKFVGEQKIVGATKDGHV